MKYNDNGTVKEIVVKSGDTLPIGTVVEYDGTTIPDGYVEVEDNISINKLATSDFITLNSGFSILDNSLYKQGKHIFGYITIGKSSAFTGSQETVGTLVNKPTTPVNLFGFSGSGNTSRWNIASNPAYVFLDDSNYSIKIRANSSDTYIKCYIDYVEV